MTIAEGVDGSTPRPFKVDDQGRVVMVYGNHAESHTDGTDDIQDATSSHKGLATSAQITKLDGIVTPMTTRGDIIIRDSSNNTSRLGIGTNTQVLTSDGADITWEDPTGGSAAASIFLPAESAYLPATNPAELVEEEGATTYAGFSYLKFDDTTSEHAVWRVPMPDYDGGDIVITAYSKVAATPAGAVTLQYNILTIGLANSEAFDAAVTVDTTVNISHSLNTTELLTDIMIASATIDPDNVSADDLMVIELSRDVGDTLVGDGELVGIMIEYTRT